MKEFPRCVRIEDLRRRGIKVDEPFVVVEPQITAGSAWLFSPKGPDRTVVDWGDLARRCPWLGTWSDNTVEIPVGNLLVLQAGRGGEPPGADKRTILE